MGVKFSYTSSSLIQQMQPHFPFSSHSETWQQPGSNGVNIHRRVKLSMECTMIMFSSPVDFVFLGIVHTVTDLLFLFAWFSIIDPPIL